MTKVCKRHADNPVMIYHQCVGCELELFHEELEQKQQEVKRLNEERNRLFERLKDIISTLGGVTFTDGRQWGAYNALCDILEEIEKELSK